MERISIRDMKDRISWGSIIAGVLTVLSISVLLSVLSSSIGLFMFNPTDAHPTSGIGTTVGIWTVISLIISLIAGGFVAGKLAGADGLIHGFMVWATTLIVTLILGAFLAVGAVKLTSNILGSISSVVGNVLSGVGSAAKSGLSGMSDEVKDLFSDVDFNTDVDNNGKNIQQDVRMALKKSGVKEFQPDYLNNQLQQIKTDFQKTVKKVATHPKDADDIINKFLDRLKKRANKFGDSINRDDLTKAIANNTTLSKAEVDKAVDQYMDLINSATQKGKEEIANLQQSIDQAKQKWEVMKQEALVKAEKATNAAARSALISFFAMLIGAILCAYSGLYGAKKTRQGYEA